MDISEVLESTGFWILTAVGVGAFSIMLIILKKMGQSELMPWWVKIITFIAIIIISALLSGWAEGN